MPDEAPLDLQLATARAETATVHRDRDALLALLATLYPAELYYDDVDVSLLVLYLPAGALQWPIPARNRDLFAFLPPALDVAPGPDGRHSDDRLALVVQSAGNNWVARERAMSAYQEPAAAPEPSTASLYALMEPAAAPQAAQEPAQAPVEPVRRPRARKSAPKPSRPLTED